MYQSLIYRTNFENLVFNVYFNYRLLKPDFENIERPPSLFKVLNVGYKLNFDIVPYRIKSEKLNFVPYLIGYIHAQLSL